MPMQFRVLQCDLSSLAGYAQIHVAAVANNSSGEVQLGIVLPCLFVTASQAGCCKYGLPADCGELL